MNGFGQNHVEQHISAMNNGGGLMPENLPPTLPANGGGAPARSGISGATVLGLVAIVAVGTVVAVMMTQKGRR